MKKETQRSLFEQFVKKQLEVITSKQQDYADVGNESTEDVLSNFKTAGANSGLSTEQQILSLIATKVARLGNLFKGKTPNNESIEDSIIDLANYTFLLHCSLNDNPNKIRVKGVSLNDGDLFTDMGLTKESINLDDVLKIERGPMILGPIKEGRKSFKNNCY